MFFRSLFMSLYDPKTTALISIDLQAFILNRSLAPHSSQQVVDNTVAIAKKLKAEGGTTIFVTVGFSTDYAAAVNQPVDETTTFPAGGLPAAAMAVPDTISALTPDVSIVKHHWSA